MKTNPKARTKSRTAWVLGALALVLAAGYVAGWFMTGRTIPRNTTIARIDVGSMTPSQAQQALAKGIADRRDEPIEARYRSTSIEFLPAEFDFKVDVAESVRQAGGQRSWSPRAIWAVVAGGSDHPPVFTVNDGALKAAVDQHSAKIDVPVLEPRITFVKSEPQLQQPRVGDIVDRLAFARAIKGAYLMTSSPVSIPVERVRPEGTTEDLNAAVRDIATPAISGPVKLTVSGKSVDLPVATWTPALSIDMVDGQMAAVLDPEKLSGPLLKATASVTNPPKNASFTFADGKPVLQPSRQGVGVDPERLAISLVPVLKEQGAERAIAVQATVVDPELTTQKAQALGIKERVSDFVTYYPPTRYRDINQSEAARRINGYVLKPGERFSFNKVVGPRTASNGFVKGGVISNGAFVNDYGGGVSQVATTTFNASFFAGLEDIEHHPHSLYLSRYPVGREATVSYGSLDLRFKNPYDTGIVIRAWVNKSAPGRQGEMHVEMYGTKVYKITAGKSERYNFRSGGTRVLKGDDCAPQSPMQGFSIDIHRYFHQSGKVVRKETHTTRYKAGDRIVCE